MTTAVDGDDYTWQTPGGAVLNGTAPVGRVERFDVTTVSDSSPVYLEVTEYDLPTLKVDLRTPDQRERDDVAALWAEIQRLRDLVALTTAPLDVALRVDNLVDALEALTTRVTALERKQRRTVLEQAAGWKD